MAYFLTLYKFKETKKTNGAIEGFLTGVVRSDQNEMDQGSIIPSPIAQDLGQSSPIKVEKEIGDRRNIVKQKIQTP